MAQKYQVAVDVRLVQKKGKSSCGDDVASEGDDSCKPTEWVVCGTVVINNYYVSPSKKEE
eukprot:13592353-Ditylum_brightwellii.AAC.1